MRARLVIVLWMIVAAPLAIPASAAALVPFDQVTVQKPNGVDYDPYTGLFWVTSVGPPPGIDIFREHEDGTWEQVDAIDLPPGSEPGDIYYDEEYDLFYVQDHAQDRYFTVCPGCGDVIEHPLPEVLFATGFAQGFDNELMTDFGDGSSAGSFRYGPNFTSIFRFGDTITPNGVDLLTGDGPVKNGRIPSLFLVIDANNNDLIKVSDAATPQVLGTEPGPPGAGGLKPPRDVATDPVNLATNPFGPATHLVLVPVPDLGNVFASRNGTGTWQPISSTPFGRPTRVAASCDTIAPTDFTNNKVTFFNEKPPKDSSCEDAFDIVASGAPLTDAGRFAVALKAYADAHGGMKADFNAFLTQHRLARPALARKASTGTRKVKLVAGRVTRVKLKLSGRARAAVFAALAHRHRLNGKLTLRLKTPSGRTVKVTSPIRIRVAR